MNKPNVEIRELLKSTIDTSSVAGSIVMVGSRDTGILFQEAIGTIHSSQNEPVNEHTLFDIQSITKVVATVSLLEEFLSLGLIALDDLLQKYVQEFHPLEKAGITIKDLLLHTSGISDEDFLGEFGSANELWSAMYQAPLRNKPGVSIEYTDVGYRLLGLCLERIGQSDLDHLCKVNVWEKIGMRNTSYNISGISKLKIAGYGGAWGVVDDSQDRLLGKPLGCDGVFSSAFDLSLFCVHWLKKLSEQKYRDSFYKVSAGNFDDNWSFYESLGLGRKVFGWESHTPYQSYLGNSHSSSAIEKAGGGGAFICLRPEKNDFFVYLTNHGRPNPFTMDTWDNLVKVVGVQSLSEKALEK